MIAPKRQYGVNWLPSVRDRVASEPALNLSRNGGFSLIEALVAMVIATLAVMGLAHTFGLGRAFINRFEVARAALGVAQQRLEILHTERQDSEDFSGDSLHVRPFEHAGKVLGTEEWAVTWYDDPATEISHDLKLVTVTVHWNFGTQADSISLSRKFFPI